MSATPGGQTGLQLTLTQQPCKQNSQTCCQDNVCAAWSGAHLATRGCILYGAVTTREWLRILPQQCGALPYCRLLSPPTEVNSARVLSPAPRQSSCWISPGATVASSTLRSRPTLTATTSRTTTTRRAQRLVPAFAVVPTATCRTLSTVLTPPRLPSTPQIDIGVEPPAGDTLDPTFIAAYFSPTETSQMYTSSTSPPYSLQLFSGFHNYTVVC